MQRDDLLQEDRLGPRYIFNSLARHRLGEKSDEIAGMSRLEGNTDFAVGLEAADSRPMSGARVDDDEGAARRVDFDPLRRDNTCEDVVDRPLEGTPVKHELRFVIEDVWGRILQTLAILIAALAQHVPEEQRPLRRIGRIFGHRRERSECT